MLKISLTLIFLISIILDFSLAIESCSSSNSTYILQTNNGQIQGVCYIKPIYYSQDPNSSINTKVDVISWLAIPYADPPINENRFKDPIPVKSWSNIRNGTISPNACLQLGKNNTSEDCLYLNIYTQRYSYENRVNNLKPILVFIHGGSYEAGSANEYDGSTVTAMSDIIMISINYRLNALGFLHSPGTTARGNQGFLDSAMALKWIYENAVNFGGDNSKITISGESAGSWDVGFLLYYPPSWPHFRNAIMESGGPTGKNNIYRLRTSNEAEDLAKIFFFFLGCTNYMNQWSVDCAQKKTSQQILAAYERVTFYHKYWNGLYETNLYYPMIDHKVFNKTIDELTGDKAFKQCSIITGHNNNEFALTTLYTTPLFGSDFNPEVLLENAKNFNVVDFYFSMNSFLNYFPIFPYQNENIIKNAIAEYFTSTELLNFNNLPNLLYKMHMMISDLLLTCQSYQMAAVYAQEGNKVYMYDLNYHSSLGYIPEQLIGLLGNSTHADDIAIVFGNVFQEQYAGILPQADRDFSQRVIFYWTNFVKYDDPSYVKYPNVVDWIPYENTGNKIEFKSNDFRIVNDGYQKHHCKFWGY